MVIMPEKSLLIKYRKFFLIGVFAVAAIPQFPHNWGSARELKAVCLWSFVDVDYSLIAQGASSILRKSAQGLSLPGAVQVPEEAYRWVQRNAMQVWETREDYRTLVERDPHIRRYLKPGEIQRIFNVERYLKHVDEIFKRVFGKS